LIRRPPEVTSSTAAVCAAPQLTDDTCRIPGEKSYRFWKKKKTRTHNKQCQPMA
jgi:hypothetical protein